MSDAAMADTGRSPKDEDKSLTRNLDNTRKRSVKDYAVDVFSVSLMNGFPNIVITDNIWRKCFKILALLLCSIGFFYQAGEFVRIYLTYPAVVDIEVYRPTKFISPAYTFCNNNGIKRSLFCAKYPDRCYKPKDIDAFCNRFKEFCSYVTDRENLVVVKPKYYKFESQASFEELIELGYDNNSIITQTDFIQAFTYALSGDDDEPTDRLVKLFGPVPVRRENTIISCFTEGLMVDNDMDLNFINSSKVGEAISIFIFDLHPNETFYPGRQAGGFFHVHSPLVFHNPYERGIFIKPGREYMVHLHLEEEHLLPSPYRTRCTDYAKLWEEQGRTGYRSQEMCLENCEYNAHINICGCRDLRVMYPTLEPYCENGTHEVCGDPLFGHLVVDDEIEKCSKQCGDDCMKIKYHYTHQSRLTEYGKTEEDLTNKEEENYGDEHNIDQHAYVSVSIVDPEVVKYHYRPQYQEIEILSVIGGFIGIWLGVSFVALIDLGESITLILTFIFKRRYRRM